jgi:hypothetical protein
MQGYSVLQLLTSFGNAPRETYSSVLLGISKITLELWSPEGDTITNRFDVEGTACVAAEVAEVFCHTLQPLSHQSA